jgi:hypothetical protein
MPNQADHYVEAASQAAAQGRRAEALAYLEAARAEAAK